jgi:hypothetical protein
MVRFRPERSRENGVQEKGMGISLVDRLLFH